MKQEGLTKEDLELLKKLINEKQEALADQLETCSLEKHDGITEELGKLYRVLLKLDKAAA